jgi:glycine dehydrogenase subunit 1
MAKFTPHTEKQTAEMVSAIGVSSVAELFKAIPKELAPESFNLPAGMTEYEALARMTQLSCQNDISKTLFTGGGYYDHFIPAAVDAISGRAEFYTAYTPYQPEASQGTLRAIFEYQTMVAKLTGLDFANASLYDGGTALYEAIAVAVRTNNKNRVIIDSGVNPLYRRIVKTYTINLDVKIEEGKLADIRTDIEKIKAMIDDNVSAIVVQNPNFFGMVEDYTELFEYAASKGVISIAVFYPVSLGLIKTPGEMKADIAVGDGQSLGLPLSFGGPYLGLMAVNKKHVRKIPGRIVGETADKEGKKAYVLTLQAREQHIKREKATSNICSNQALCALRAVVYLALIGKGGFKDLALINLEKAELLKEKLKAAGVKVKEGATFNEFTIEVKGGARQFVEKMAKKGISAGVPASLFYEGMDNYVIVAATEKRTDEEIEKFAKAVKDI